MTERNCHLWWVRFSSGERTFDNIEDKKRSGRRRSGHSPANVEAVRQIVNADRRITITDIQDQSGLTRGTVHKILKKDLQMSRIAAKFVPKDLNQEQLDARVEICSDWLRKAEADMTILDWIVTGDESWVACYDPETKKQSSQWTAKGEPRPKKFLQARSVKKVMLTVFFDSSGVILVEFLDGGTVKAETYIQTLMNLRDCIRKRRPHLWTAHNWILLDDNASPHTAHDTLVFHRQVLTQRGRHPAYSPDLAASDFFLFPKMKARLRGIHFKTKDDLKEGVLQALQSIPVQDFANCFHLQLQQRWAKCVANKGQYFEGDRVSID